jgi:hypothetical protein
MFTIVTELSPKPSVPPRAEQERGDRCPTCGGPIVAIVSTGPSRHVIRPCGHDVGPLTVRELTGGCSSATLGGALTDGGSTNRDAHAVIKEAFYEYGELRCEGCNNEPIDLSDAADLREAKAIWNEHVRSVHGDEQ